MASISKKWLMKLYGFDLIFPYVDQFVHSYGFHIPKPVSPDFGRNISSVVHVGRKPAELCTVFRPPVRSRLFQCFC